MCHMLIRRFFSPQDFKARNQTLISSHSKDFSFSLRYLQKLLFLFCFWDVLTMLLLAKIVHTCMCNAHFAYDCLCAGLARW